VKLLFDENLSPRLVGELSSHWPGSTHIELLGMRGASDEASVDADPDLADAILKDGRRQLLLDLADH
jgi:predicted nuclease of predicted toxin-antitoxin system